MSIDIGQALKMFFKKPEKVKPSQLIAEAVNRNSQSVDRLSETLDKFGIKVESLGKQLNGHANGKPDPET